MFVFLCVMFSVFECAACNSKKDPGLFRVSLFINEQWFFFSLSLVTRMNMIFCSYVKFVYFFSPLLGNQPQHGSELPSPNLRPRHQELIPTPCGPVRYLTLPCREVKRMFSFLFFCLWLSQVVSHSLSFPSCCR